MGQTEIGARRAAAKRLRVSLAEYDRRRGRGQKWCSLCRRWHDESAFSVDRHRYDRLASSCRLSRNAQSRQRYHPKARYRGRKFVPARDGDKLQARRRINYLVEVGLLPHPNTIPCADCGHEWAPNGKRHEYDHHRGYRAQYHEHVEAVCSTCHHKRPCKA